MRLSGTVPYSVVRLCQPYKGSGATCSGIPPIACSAFGRQSRLSLVALDECISCPANEEETIVKFSIVAVLVPVGVAAYVFAVDHYPRYREWIATSSLVLNHVQVVGLLGSLAVLAPGNSLPSALVGMLRLLQLFSSGVTAVHPQCLLPPQPRLEMVDRTIQVTNPDGSTSDLTLQSPVFTLAAFLVSPGFGGTVCVFVLPVLAFVTLSIAKCGARRFKAHTAIEQSMDTTEAEEEISRDVARAAVHNSDTAELPPLPSPL
eukprot:5434944-Prymnesium_polylepis.1